MADIGLNVFFFLYFDRLKMFFSSISDGLFFRSPLVPMFIRIAIRPIRSEGDLFRAILNFFFIYIKNGEWQRFFIFRFYSEFGEKYKYWKV